MCGIGGIWGSDPRTAAPMLEAMTGAMRHRGPDDSGTELFAGGEHHGGICATRLAIQAPGSGGHQPMVSPLSGRKLAFNGELYNVAELRQQLESAGVRLRGGSDTEVALRAYDEWGPACVEHFRGMFALALWDAPAGRIFLARDRLGIKPLYYHRGGQAEFAFASELKALLAAGAAPAELCPNGLSSFLATGAVVEPFTILADVRALPAGHTAMIDAGSVRLEPYWSAGHAVADGPPAPRRAQAVAELRAELEEAVRLHLVSDVPLGVFLSGGVDSNAVAALTKLAGGPPRTVSVSFDDDPELSEGPLIRRAVEKLGSEHTDIVLTEGELLAQLSGALDAMDQPTVDGMNTYVISGAARASGLKVALSGLGGDELFAGYSTFTRTRPLELLRRATAGPLGPAVASVVDRRPRGDPGAKIARWLRRRDCPPTAYELQRELFAPSRRVALAAAASAGASVSSTNSRVPADLVNRVSLLELQGFMRNQLLRDSDVMSMAHGLELRVPLLDHVLVESVLALPGRYKRRPGRIKPLLADAIADLVPPEILTGKKRGFTFPFERWLRGRLGQEVTKTLRDPDYGGAAARALEQSAIEGVIGAFEAGQTNWARPWSLYVLESWAERHLPR